MVRKIGDRCVGRRADGRQCYSSGQRWFIGLPFCVVHAEELVREVGAADPVRVIAAHTRGPHVVYYAGDPATKLIKIGTSHNFRARFVALSTRYPGLKLLAVEPGHFDLESARHRQFRHLRVATRGAQREWFRKESALMEHVRLIRFTWGDPFSYEAGS